MQMADVVKISSAKRKPRKGGTKGRPEKTALVLGGGGMTGAVYEIGALRALDLLAVNRNVNEFDIYVGTSAGAFVAASLPAPAMALSVGFQRRTRSSTRRPLRCHASARRAACIQTF